MRNKKVVVILLVVLSSFLFAGFQNSLKFSSNVEESCGIVFKSRGSIAFKDENPKYLGEFEIISNLHKHDKVLFKIKNLKKSVNLLDINNSKIYLVFDRFKKVRVSEVLNRGVELRSKTHNMYIYIDKRRSSTKSGRTTLSFELEPICDT